MPLTDDPPLTTNEVFQSLLDSRTSVRGFLSEPVAPEVLRKLLLAARLAPSGANLQPGRFWQVRGDLRGRLCDSLLQAFRDRQQEDEDYCYFPEPLPMGLRKRQAASAQALYGALGIGRGDKAARDAQFERNFCFFDAPVALVVSIERDFGPGGFMDLGMALYGLMLAARAQGLDTCAIGALASYPNLIRGILGLDSQQSIVCGLAIGRADPEAPVNQCRTSRCNETEYFQVLGKD